MEVTLRKELVRSWKSYLIIWCIEHSTNPYALGLVDGSLRVHMCGLLASQPGYQIPTVKIGWVWWCCWSATGIIVISLQWTWWRGTTRWKQKNSQSTELPSHVTCDFSVSAYAIWVDQHLYDFSKINGQIVLGKEWESVFVYLDDILVFLTTLEGHLKNVGKVSDCLKDAGLKLSPTKWQLLLEIR